MKSAAVAAAATALAAPASAGEMTIFLTAMVEERCNVVDMRAVGAELDNAFQVSVVCNAPRFRLAINDGNGAVPVTLDSTAGLVGQVNAGSQGLLVSPILPGFYQFQMRIDENHRLAGGLQIQLNGL